MKQENHFGEAFTGVCPHCGSSEIQEFPTVNFTRKFGCNTCEWVWGVRWIDPNTGDCIRPVVLGCFYLEGEK